jgi:hypothetical protein
MGPMSMGSLMAPIMSIQSSRVNSLGVAWLIMAIQGGPSDDSISVY